MNETAIESEGADAVLSILDNELGGWPILNGLFWNETQYNLSHLLFKLRAYNHNIIYNCGTQTDDRNSSAYFIRVGENERKRKYGNEKRNVFCFRLDKVIWDLNNDNIISMKANIMLLIDNLCMI